VATANKAVEAFGGKLLDWNLTLGPYDAVAKVEFPDDQTMAALALTIAASGNQETTTMPAFGESELKGIIKKKP
jgi:uncharacterized protein with GYD domain